MTTIRDMIFFFLVKSLNYFIKHLIYMISFHTKTRDNYVELWAVYKLLSFFSRPTSISSEKESMI